MAASDLTLRIEHETETSTLTVPSPEAIDTDAVTLATIAVDRRLDDIDRAEATVFRDEWLNVLDLLDQRNDEAFIETEDGTDIFGGRVDDWQFEGVLVSVFLDSFEIDARQSEPETFSRTDTADDQIASDLIGLMPAPLSAGTVEQSTSSLDFSGTQRRPASLLRDLAGTTGSELRYRADGTVDYLNRRGTVRSEVIGPANLVGEPRLRNAAEQNATDVRAISIEDRTLFEDAEAISTDGRQVYRTETVDSTSSSRLQARATSVANEIADAPEYIELGATLDPLSLDSDPAIGDEYPVELPAFGVDTALRIVDFDRRIGEDGETAKVTLANRVSTLAARDTAFGV